MYVGYDEEQEALRQELRAYYAELLTPEVQEGLADAQRRRPRHAQGRQADGRRRLARASAGRGVRRPGPQPDRAVHLLRRVDAGRRPGADAHHQHGRPDDHAATAPRSRRTSSSRRSSPGEIHFCIGYTEPDAGTDLAVAQDPGRARRRRVRHQRPEDLHQSSPATPTTAGSRCAPTPTSPKHKGISIIIVPMDTPGFTVAAASNLLASTTSTHVFYEDVRVPAANLVGGENKRLDAHHQPAQPRAGHAVLVRACSSRRYERRPALGPGDQAGRRPPGHRPGVGAAQPGPGARRPRVPAPHQLEGRVGADAGRASTSADASTIKVFGTEFYLEAFRLLMEVLGPAAYLQPGIARGASSASRLERNVPQPHHPHLRRRASTRCSAT